MKKALAALVMGLQVGLILSVTIGGMFGLVLLAQHLHNEFLKALCVFGALWVAVGGAVWLYLW